MQPADSFHRSLFTYLFAACSASIGFLLHIHLASARTSDRVNSASLAPALASTGCPALQLRVLDVVSSQYKANITGQFSAQVADGWQSNTAPEALHRIRPYSARNHGRR